MKMSKYKSETTRFTTKELKCSTKIKNPKVTIETIK